jgi:hypothetical protein
MALTNAERQARHRERLKRLVAQGRMTPVRADLLADTRRRIRENRRSAVLFDRGEMRLLWGNSDHSAAHVSELRRQIAEGERLLAEYDPDDLTKDDNVEIGDIGHLSPRQLGAGQIVIYSLDAGGRAVVLTPFDSEGGAIAFVRGVSGRFAGTVGDDNWSIVPFDDPAIETDDDAGLK